MNRLSARLPSLRAVRVVALLTALNLLILGIRNLVNLGDDAPLDFLLSNLFSGFVPLLIAYLMLVLYRWLPTALLWVGAVLWLLFYPNSPYMISDLIHINLNHDGVFNALIIFSIAMLSVFYGFLSLKIVYNLFRHRYNVQLASAVVVVSILLSSLGFYMGRAVKGFAQTPNPSVLTGTIIPVTHIPASSPTLCPCLLLNDESKQAADATMARTHTPNLYTSDFLLHPITTVQKVLGCLWPLDCHRDAYFMMGLIAMIQFALLAMMRGVGDYEADIMEYSRVQPVSPPVRP